MVCLIETSLHFEIAALKILGLLVDALELGVASIDPLSNFGNASVYEDRPVVDGLDLLVMGIETRCQAIELAHRDHFVRVRLRLLCVRECFEASSGLDVVLF